MHPFTHSLSPDAAVVLATLGVFLGFFECNRPGSILPGALGLLCLLLAIGALQPDTLSAAGGIGLLVSLLVLTASLRWSMPGVVSIAATAGLVGALHSLVARPGVSWPVAILCGATLGLVATFLANGARRARHAKQLVRQSR